MCERSTLQFFSFSFSLSLAPVVSAFACIWVIGLPLSLTVPFLAVFFFFLFFIRRALLQEPRAVAIRWLIGGLEGSVTTVLVMVLESEE